MKTISFEWNGKALHITESEAFEIGERIEEIVTLTEIAEMDERPKFRKLARAFCEMITFAGGTATPREVHQALMAQVKDGDSDFLMAAIQCLVEILMDGAPEGGEDNQDGGKKASS